MVCTPKLRGYIRVSLSSHWAALFDAEMQTVLGIQKLADRDRVQPVAQHYGKAGINTDTLQSQLEVAKSLSDCQPSKPSDIHSFRDILSSSPDAFSDLLKLVDIVLTLPVTTASNERMFSTLGRVKNYLRSSCGNDRLSDLLVLSCLTEDAKDIDLWEVVDSLARLKTRRYPLFH
jgi:hypothetical protein